MVTVNQAKKPFALPLRVVGFIFLAAVVVTSAVTPAQADTVRACLVRTIDTSRWSPPSPDPMGITVLPNGHLLVSDSEVEECVNSNPPVYWHGVNLFEADRSGTLLATATTYTPPPGSCTPFFGPGPNFTSEPTGVTINPTNGHLFFSDDDKKRIFEVDLGPDGKYGTADDIVTSFSTSPLNPAVKVDPEGVAFGEGDLFVVSGGISGGGGDAAVYQIDPGPNGRFDGVPPAGDDVVVNRFEVAPLGVGDSEGVAFDSDTGNLYVIGRDRHLIEVTTTGVLVRTIDISALPFVAPADVVYAPGSLNLLIKHLYIVDRGVDNNVDPLENDGKMYEITVNPIECILPPPL